MTSHDNSRIASIGLTVFMCFGPEGVWRWNAKNPNAAPTLIAPCPDEQLQLSSSHNPRATQIWAFTATQIYTLRDDGRPMERVFVLPPENPVDDLIDDVVETSDGTLCVTIYDTYARGI